MLEAVLRMWGAQAKCILMHSLGEYSSGVNRKDSQGLCCFAHVSGGGDGLCGSCGLSGVSGWQGRGRDVRDLRGGASLSDLWVCVVSFVVRTRLARKTKQTDPATDYGAGSKCCIGGARTRTRVSVTWL